MTWEPTNANDVRLTVSQVERNDNGDREGTTTIANTAQIVVDDFSIDTDEDMSALSGITNVEGIGVSQGDVGHEFSFTVQGEDAELFAGLASDNGRAVELEIIATGDRYKDTLTKAYAGTRNYSGTSGDPTEFEVEGIALSRNPRVDV
jgi:hypothetical protein